MNPYLDSVSVSSGDWSETERVDETDTDIGDSVKIIEKPLKKRARGLYSSPNLQTRINQSST